MSKMFLKMGFGALALAGLVWPASAAAPGALKQLRGHVPAAVAHLVSTGHLDGTNRLHLAIGLPLRNQDGLNALLQQVNDSSSQNYHHYLTADQFNAQFGPTEQDYQSVLEFAQTNGLTVTRKHGNRLLVEVSAQASDIEHAFHVTLNKYRNAKENRNFYSPDTEPSVPAGLSALDVSGLNNYSRPHPKIKFNPNNQTSPHNGSGPGGNYMGYDFRAAYVPGTALTGAGQKIALVQFDGYYASDIAQYAAQAGLPGVPLTNILLNGFSGIPTGSGGEVEVSLDIEMVISMAPNLSQVLVYEGDPFNFIPNVVLNQIAADNAARQVSCSWGWIGGPNATSDQIFQEMTLQGQSFFNASGDSDAFLPGQVDDPNQFGFPSCSPYITQVGGTTLATSGRGGPRTAEIVWNWGLLDPVYYDGVGSSGGVSDHYVTPSWQVGFGTAANHGSTTGRNIPDVALTADNVYVIADNGIAYPGTGGTSCAAPLWAGFTALVNQQAALSGKFSVGFINPAIYSIAKTAAYTNDFNDITAGNNTWSASPTNFFAVPGYDLCTGLGTPNGTNLINALTGAASTTPPILSAPARPWGATLAGLYGSNPNGAWFLFVQDDATPDSGMINSGWSVTLTTAYPVGYAADNQLYVTSTLTNTTAGSVWPVTLAVTNYGPSSATNVFVTDILPAPGNSVTLVSSNATMGTVAVFGDSLTWTIGNLPINSGASLTLNFYAATNALGLYTNSATVNATTGDPNSDDDTGAVTLLVSGAPPTPPQLTPGYNPATGTFQLTVTGTTGESVIVQASTNLVSWFPIATNLVPFTNSFATSNYPALFYRAVVGP